MMQVGNLPLPLPILTPAFNADFPSVHIGIKVSVLLQSFFICSTFTSLLIPFHLRDLIFFTLETENVSNKIFLLFIV